METRRLLSRRQNKDDYPHVTSRKLKVPKAQRFLPSLLQPAQGQVFWPWTPGSSWLSFGFFWSLSFTEAVAVQDLISSPSFQCLVSVRGPIITMYIQCGEHFKKKMPSHSNDHLSACGQIKIPRGEKKNISEDKAQIASLVLSIWFHFISFP